MITRRKPVFECWIGTWTNAAGAAAVLLACLGSVASAQAEPSLREPRLRLGELYRSVEAASPRLEAAQQLTRAAEARIAPARRPPDPQLQFGLMNRNFPSFGLQDPLGMNQVQLMQMVPIAGKLGLAGRVAKAQAGATRERSEDLRWELRSRAAMAFYDLYQTDQSLAVAVETQRLLRDIAKTAETMYAVGQGRQPDVLRAQVELARMTEEITRMHAMRASMVARLNALLDRSQNVEVPSPELPRFPADLPSLDSLERLALANRPMLKAGEQDLQAARAGARLARREIWPDLQVGITYGQRPMEAGTDRMISIMLGFTVPIFAGSRQLQMRRETEAMQLMAAADLQAMRAETRGRLGELYAEVDRVRNLGTLYRTTVLPQSDATAVSATAAYRVGGVDFMTLLDARMTVNKYRQDLYQLEAEEGKALAELEMLVGHELFDPNTAGRQVTQGGYQ
ncbi:MAG TPA: TolC family protein [bacterium]